MNGLLAKEVGVAAYGSGEFAKTAADVKKFEESWNEDDWIGKKGKKAIALGRL